MYRAQPLCFLNYFLRYTWLNSTEQNAHCSLALNFWTRIDDHNKEPCKNTCSILFVYNGKKSRMKCLEKRTMKQVMKYLAGYKKRLVSDLQFVLQNGREDVIGEKLAGDYRDQIIQVIDKKEERTHVNVTEHVENHNMKKHVNEQAIQEGCSLKSVKNIEADHLEKKKEEKNMQWSGNCVFCDRKYTNLQVIVKHYCTEHLWDMLVKQAATLKNYCVECSKDTTDKVEIVMHQALHHNLLNNFLIHNGHPSLPTAQLVFRHNHGLLLSSARRKKKIDNKSFETPGDLILSEHSYSDFERKRNPAVIKEQSDHTYSVSKKIPICKNTVKELSLQKSILNKKFVKMIEKTNDILQCTECKKSFVTKIQAMQHVKRKSCRKDRSKKGRPTQARQCTVENCGEEFPNSKEFRRHQSLAHPLHTACDCGVTARRQVDYRRHVLICKKVKPTHKCDDCNYRSPYVWMVQRHVKRVHNTVRKSRKYTTLQPKPRTAARYIKPQGQVRMCTLGCERLLVAQGQVLTLYSYLETTFKILALPVHPLTD